MNELIEIDYYSDQRNDILEKLNNIKMKNDKINRYFYELKNIIKYENDRFMYIYFTNSIVSGFTFMRDIPRNFSVIISMISSGENKNKNIERTMIDNLIIRSINTNTKYIYMQKKYVDKLFYAKSLEFTYDLRELMKERNITILSGVMLEPLNFQVTEHLGDIINNYDLDKNYIINCTVYHLIKKNLDEYIVKCYRDKILVGYLEFSTNNSVSGYISCEITNITITGNADTLYNNRMIIEWLILIFDNICTNNYIEKSICNINDNEIVRVLIDCYYEYVKQLKAQFIKKYNSTQYIDRTVLSYKY
jgi:hypothetical protein